MSGEFLSQDEVDALLRGVSGEEEGGGATAAAAAESGTRPYNIATQERIVRGRMPALDVINDRFVRLIRVSLFNFLRRTPEVSLLPVKVVKYSEFIRNLVVPTNLNIMAMKPLRGSTLFVCEPSLVFTVIDSMFGGDGRFRTHIEGRDFTGTEQRIIQRLLGVFTEEYQKSWKPVHEVSFEYVRSEMHTQFANIATPSEVVVVSSFKIDLGESGGALHICIPYSTIEPIRDVLYSTMQGDHFEPDRRWLRMLQKQVQLADVELVAKLAHIPVTIQQLLNMKVGDVLSVDMPQRVEASVDGVPIFECEYGTSSSQYALKVGKVLAVSQKDNQLGDSNV